jgi:3-dehydroquinate synthase
VQRVRVRLKARPVDYEIMIGAGALAHLGDQARRTLSPHARRIVIVSNHKVFDLYGKAARDSLGAAGFKVEHLLMGDGERYKSFKALESTLLIFHTTGLERSDAVVALGGGVVGDLAGFAAAIYLRGISFLQVPTTLLAQIDASVGGKTAINTKSGKNIIGAFHQPRAVLIDTRTLQTLPRRELTAGWCEAVKQGAAGSRELFERTFSFLREQREQGVAIQHGRALDELIAAQCAFKASIVSGDEREDVERTDWRSRRILNFGHTTAHTLEAITHYRRFRHGEAVGHGMLVGGEISHRLGLLDVSELELLREAVRLTGRLPRADHLDQALILSALAHDKKSIGGHIQWVLLERLGRAVLVDNREIAPRLIRASLRAALKPLKTS